jgi:hypothetical protein
MSRISGLLALLVLVTGAGCGYDEGKDLPGIVEAAAPAGSQVVGACGGSPGLIEPPSHGCTFFASGESRKVAVAVARALIKQGFEVSCRGGGVTIEVTGLRGDVRADSEITGDGTVTTSGGVVNVFAPGYVPPGADPIPTGSVALELSASRQSDASAGLFRTRIREGAPCSAAGLRRQTIDSCIEQWNSLGNETNRRLALQRARAPAVNVFRLSEVSDVSSGCQFGFLAPRGRYLILESTWEDDHLVWAKPELGYFSGKGFQPHAKLRPDGTLRLIRRN